MASSGEGSSLHLQPVALARAGLSVGRVGLADQQGRPASDPSPSPGQGSPLVGLVWLTSRGLPASDPSPSPGQGSPLVGLVRLTSRGVRPLPPTHLVVLFGPVLISRTMPTETGGLM